MRVKRIRGNILGSVVDARSWSFLIQDLVQKFIKIGSLPSAVGKSAAGVLLRPAGSLDNAIDCDKRQDNQFSHGCSFLPFAVLRCWYFNLLATHARDIPDC